MLGVLLALLSAATFAFNNAAARRGVLSGSVLQAMVVSVPFGVPFFLVCLPIFGSFEDLWSFSWWDVTWLSLAGIIHFVVGRYANYRSQKAIGANLSGPIQDANILIALALAVWFLGETLTGGMIIGIVLVLFGPILAFKRPKPVAAPSARALAFTPAYGEGFFYSAVSAIAYGVSPILVRFSLENGGLTLGRAVAAGLISYAAATAVVFAAFVNPAAWRDLRTMRRGDFGWFAVASLFVGVAQMTRYMALAVAPVAIVAPMMRLASIFRYYFSWILNREYEAFSNGVFIGTVVSLVGAMILAIGIDTWVAILPDFDWLIRFISWRWP
ncbi:MULTISPECIES: DMT family transporter [unclassified Beijerinckia]|uniref:DMT family transporter n=1 Tax=unclassified Beijerinckia TaxID=2638183 RepID=UPI00089A0F47|nr:MULTISPECIES: DMT family transporter [unclassified Beijerinckia]MDH7798499.1 drug/metabolite transporter (DMT)-like permease [Beijerinckia sp. GAS462]SED22929.1 EamA-like transporter family protein [Beijerinckia sp. 28-YEA-48]